jgi:hypothetical protein
MAIEWPLLVKLFYLLCISKEKIFFQIIIINNLL